MALNTDLIPFTKINPKWITELNVKCRTIKFLEDNTKRNLDDLSYASNFLGKTPKMWFMKEIFDKLDLLTLKISVLQRHRQEDGKSKIKWKYLQKKYLIKDHIQTTQRTPESQQ